jgi:hypothetical protein
MNNNSLRRAVRRRHRSPYFLVIITVLSATVGQATVAGAIDTVETWDAGAVDVDFYAGYCGVGHSRENRWLAGELMLGYGIIDRFSAYLGATLSTNEMFSTASSEVFLGIFGTPVDTAHFDMDIFFDMRAAGFEGTDFTLRPAIELNVDSDDEMGFIGAFLSLGFPIYGQALGQAGDVGAETEVTSDIEATIGGYITLAERHQIFLAYTMLFRIRPRDRERVVEVGSAAVGYNVTLHDSIELVGEVCVDIPQDDESVTAGFMLGFIATVPSSRSQESLEGG